MKNLPRIFLWTLLSLGWPFAVHGVTLDHLYTAQVPVQGRGEAARMKALHQALRQVLVKVAGTRAVLERFDAAYADTKIDLMPWVHSYAYQSTAQDPSLAAGQSLRVKFIAEAIDTAIDKSGGGRWSKNRPLVLTWIALEHDGQARLVNRENAPELCAIVESAAWRRGVPILFPLLDIEDLRQLPPAALNTATPEQVADATARYAPDLVLSVYLRPGAQGWQADWQLFEAARPLSWSRTAMDLPVLIDKGIDTVSDTLAGQYVRHSEASPASFELVVEDLKQFSDYARIWKYLQTLDMVTEIKLLEMEPGTARYHLTVRGGVDGFARNVALGRVLEASGENSEKYAVYRLKP